MHIIPSKIIIPMVLLLLYIIIPSQSSADTQTEISHLIKYIEASTCTFIRNKKVHDNQDASAHIQKKYTRAKPWVKTAEDFIKYAATESSMTGQPYYVVCDGVKIPTAQWLTEELARFRNRTQ